MTVALAATEYGDAEANHTPVLAILHGLFGSARNWATIAQRLAVDRKVIVFDLRNHGNSPWADTMSYPEMAEDVRAALHRRRYHRYALLGHSMGGKAAMTAALSHPSEVERLIVVDIAPVPYRPRHLSLVQAMRRLDLTTVTRRGEADARLASAITDRAERGFLLQNLVFGDGPPRWRLNLDAIERDMPNLVGWTDPAEAPAYPGPALFVAGDQSDYVRRETETAIRRLFPSARVARIENAGHWVHAEQPDAFVQTVQPFLRGS